MTRTLNYLRGTLLIAFLALASVHGTEVATRSYDIPATDAETALRTFSQQSGKGVIAATDLVQGVRTNAVKGDLTAAQALDQLLLGTGLIGNEDKKSGSFAVRRETPEESKNGPSRLADAQAANRLNAEQAAQEAERVRIKDGMVQLEDYTVTGSRIRGVLGEATVQPVFTYTRADLDRFGVQTFADLRRYIPQLPQTDWNTQLETAFMGSAEVGTGAQGFTDFGTGLRNLGGTATLVLLDGRRLPKMGQRFVNTAGYDLSGIPLSAVERIEVLTDGASAVYGADALAGVINIILKREYRGTELNAGYTNSFSSDTAEKQVQLSHGFRRRGFSLMLSASWSDTNSLSPRDRWWSASNDKRPWGGTDGRPAVPTAQGAVRTIDGSNLPGLNFPQAAIPVNSSGQGLTIADFANTPIPDRVDYADYTDYGNRQTENVRLSLGQVIRPWLEVFATGAWNRNITVGRASGILTTQAALASQRLILPPGYPGNPFGVPLYLERALWEFLPLMDTDVTMESYDASFGIKGNVKEWRYEMAATLRKTNYEVAGKTYTNGGPNSIYQRLQTSVNETNPAARVILLHDATASVPHSAEFYHQFLNDRFVGEVPDVASYDFKADGPIWSLPAGAMQLAIGAELQRERADLGPVSTSQRLGGIYERDVVGIFAELQVPLISEEQRVPSVHRLSLNLSARTDEYSDFEGKTVPRVGLFYGVTRWLALRASYGMGFKVPTLHQLYRVRAEQNILTSISAPLIDPLRNGETFRSFRGISGGNSDLTPEESKNLNVGVVLEIPGVKGLSLSADYYELTHDSRITIPASQDVIYYFPDRVIREAPTAADNAAGIPGRITMLDTRAVNLAYAQVKGVDFELRYHRPLGSWGDMQLRLTGSKPAKMVIRASPGAALIDQTAQTPWRSTGMAYWSRDAWEVGSIVTYTHDYLTAANIAIDPVTLWDFQASYDFGRSSWRPTGWLRHVIGEARLTAKIINAFDKEPHTRLGSSLGNVDPRGRRYQIAFQRKF